MAQETGPAVFGEEKLNADAMSIVDRTIVPGEQILSLSGFDHESKIIAVTNQKILITHKEQGIVFQSPYSGIKEVERNGRTLVIRTSDDARHEYRMRKDDTVESLVNAIRELMPDSPDAETAPTATQEAIGIAEKVKFWQEQDKINQELIPRVIHQNEMLTAHIKDHETLPIIAAAAARQAVEQGLLEYRQELESARAEREAQNRQLALAKKDNRRTKILAIAACAVAATAMVLAVIL